MRYLVTPLYLILSGFVLSVLIAGVATADDDAAKKGDRNDRRAEMRQRMLEEFDADGDGELSEDERATAREEMRKRRGGQGKSGKAKGERGPKRDGRPNPGQLFDKFDANGDGQLSRAEFMKLSEEVRANRPPRGHAKRKGSRRDGARPPRPGGSPKEGRRRFDRERSLQNPGDQGPRRPGAEGHRPPSPDAVFDRFDEDGDDQLSREEFMKLADRMRRMHKRHGRAGGHGGDHQRMRDGHGPRRGPPEEEGPPRRSRRPRPESDAGPELPATEDNSV